MAPLLLFQRIILLVMVLVASRKAQQLSATVASVRQTILKQYHWYVLHGLTMDTLMFTAYIYYICSLMRKNFA